MPRRGAPVGSRQGVPYIPSRYRSSIMIHVMHATAIAFVVWPNEKGLSASSPNHRRALGIKSIDPGRPFPLLEALGTQDARSKSSGTDAQSPLLRRPASGLSNRLQ